MAWTDRLLTATYISPSGIPFNFQYENVSLESTKKTATFLFPELDGAFIQDLGIAGRRFPFTVFFSGEDYDTTSDAFLAALEEKGIGQLIHPKYGVKSVVPTGSITRRDDLLNSANQAAFDVGFSETLTGLNFPASIENILNSIKTAITAFQTASSDQFASDLNAVSASEQISVKQVFEAQRFVIEQAFESIAKTSDELNAAFQTVNNSLVETIQDSLIDSPDIISSQLMTFIRIPSESTIDISEKVTQYNTVINVELAKDPYEQSISSSEPDNAFISNQVQVFTALTAECESVLNAEFKTRNEAIDISESILTTFDSIQTWQDANITSLVAIDTGESYDALVKVVSLAVAFLVDLSFDLPAEKIIVLGEDRNIIELVAELYEDLDQIDFFIQTNDLTVDEIEVLPQGKQVVYYA
jgi:hypothetical protein